MLGSSLRLQQRGNDEEKISVRSWILFLLMWYVSKKSHFNIKFDVMKKQYIDVPFASIFNIFSYVKNYAIY